LEKFKTMSKKKKGFNHVSNYWKGPSKSERIKELEAERDTAACLVRECKMELEAAEAHWKAACDAVYWENRDEEGKYRP
jgi:hypothetical protein